jgi:hypothetical protein
MHISFSILLVSPFVTKGLANGRTLLQGTLLTCAIFKDAELTPEAISWIYMKNTFSLFHLLHSVLYISLISSPYKLASLFFNHCLTALPTLTLYNKVLNEIMSLKAARFYINK